MSENQKNDDPSRDSLETLYEKMNRVFRRNLEKAGALTEESFEKALKESREWARQLKDHYAEDIPKVTEFLRRDFQEAVRQAGDQTRRRLDLNRIGAGVMGLVQRMAQKAGSQLDSFASKLDERLAYKTGEVAGPGTLTCTQCSQQLVFDAATRIPPCPKCHNTGFRRSY